MQNKSDRVLLGHGSGGRLTHELIEALFKRSFSNPVLNALDDAASFPVPRQKGDALAFTTDAFVVQPLFFPGGDIGKLAVFGTVNDLAMKGAAPLGISVAAIIEEGLEMEVLRRVTSSVASAAKKAGVPVVTGDTKVVERGKADRLFLATSGVGIIAKKISLSGANARPGDAVLINGSIGDHGIAVLAARNEFNLTLRVRSDCAPLNHLVQAMLSSSPGIHVLRDPTRGGLATTLNEIANASGVGIIIDERALKVSPSVRSACALLGLDPLYVANEGKVVAMLPDAAAGKVIAAMRRNICGRDAAVIGRVVRKPRGVWVSTAAGGFRPVVMLEGEQLPRIC